jgi:hypothetical protein
VLTQHRFVDDLHTGHNCRWGTNPHPRNNAFDGVRLTFERGLDGAVVVVSYPPGNTRSASFTLTALPEEHALDSAFHDDASPDHALSFAAASVANTLVRHQAASSTQVMSCGQLNR